MSKALLAVSFGTSYADTRERTIDAINSDLKEAFPERVFYQAWTSGHILKKLRARGETTCDTLTEALERMVADGVTDVLIQPTYLLDGYEMQLCAKTVAEWKGRFAHVAMGTPLLSGEEDIEALAKILEEAFADEVGSGNMLALMGHGSEDTAVNVYEILERCFRRDGFDRFCVGSVEFEPGFAPVLAQAKRDRPGTVWLAPLMVVAGDHATNDMAGDEDGSWKSQLAREGFAVNCVLKGMGEYPTIRRMYVEHAMAAKAI